MPSRRPAHWPRPRCESVGGEGYRCRLREHGPDVDHCAVGWPGMMLWDDESAFEPKTQVVGTPWGTYDVGVLKGIAAERGEPVDVHVLDHVDPDAIERHHWPTVDVATPVVLVGGRVVDGRHRLYKAWRKGLSAVPGWSLTPDQARPAAMTPRRLAEVDRADAEYRRWAGID